MFCKKCGKEIADDSLFCQFCGQQLSDSLPSKKRLSAGLINWFQSLTKGWQICVMAYICWLFLWIILSISDIWYENEGIIYFIVFALALPILALFVWYYIMHIRPPKTKSKVLDGKPMIESKPSSEGINCKSDYSVYPLLEFAKEYGKMQVKVETDGIDHTISYCIFTKPDGEVTHVDFGSNTIGMKAADISSKKELLFVVKYPNSTFKLFKL